MRSNPHKKKSISSKRTGISKPSCQENNTNGCFRKNASTSEGGGTMFNFSQIPLFPKASHKPKVGHFNLLTASNADEELFQTSFSESNIFSTQTPGTGVTTPSPTQTPPATSGNHCTPTIISSSLPSGHIPATVNGGRFSAPFTMSADFHDAIPCRGGAGEYRQYVSGFSQVNGTDIVHPLCSNNMSRTTEHEDCLTQGGTNLKYGYHSIPFSNSRFSNPDQATGTSYRGRDAPGFNLGSFPSGTVLNWMLNFRGVFVDSKDGDRPIQPASTWTAGGTYTIP